MKTILIFLAMVFFSQNATPQSDAVMKFIFVPHPRSEDAQNLTVLPSIEKIDYSKFQMILLGGDLSWYTSINRKAMDYCDSLFNLGSPKTLWTIGNHDISNPGLISEYTGRPRFYSYYSDSITFLVLDTEMYFNGSHSTFISGSQLEMIRNVADTIEISNYLVVLHHRLLWMIGNSDFSSLIPLVGQSTHQLDTTNFYQEVYPLLKKVKDKGIGVICLGGDKSKINIEYSPEANITFLTSTMAPEFPDSINCVLVLEYSKYDREISWDFVNLDAIEKIEFNPVPDKPSNSVTVDLRVWQTREVSISCEIKSGSDKNAMLSIYSIRGELVYCKNVATNREVDFSVRQKGFYLVQAKSGSENVIKRIIVN